RNLCGTQHRAHPRQRIVDDSIRFRDAENVCEQQGAPPAISRAAFRNLHQRLRDHSVHHWLNWSASIAKQHIHAMREKYEPVGINVLVNTEMVAYETVAIAMTQQNFH